MIIKTLINAIYDLVNLLKPNKLFVYGMFAKSKGKIVANNWGDDINYWFLREYTDLNVLPVTKVSLLLYRKMQPYSCIGSLLGQFADPRIEVWGSGLISDSVDIKCPPRIIHSVRGPLTRSILIKQGLDCPAVYGDPALLVSQFYKPSIQKKYKIGIIVHYIDENCSAVREYCTNHDNSLLIKMTGYNDWHDVIDKICSCEKIVSSSLHGLIISDAYEIPNLWVKFSDNITGGYFKFWDYFSSVGRKCVNAIVIDNSSCLETTISNSDFEVAESIDYKAIFESCPFKRNFKNIIQL